MKIKDLASKVLEFASNNKEGFTLNISTLVPVTSGIVVSHKATQNSFTETDLQSVINHALKHDGVVGGWFNEADGKYYFDSNKVFNANELYDAIAFGLDNDQIAIFDIDNMREIRLDGKEQTAENQAFMIKEFNFSTFADWMLNAANQVVKHYKGDILIDAKVIVGLRSKHLFNPQSCDCQVFSLYWGIRETGTWIYHVEGDNRFSLNDLMKGLGAKNVYLITFQYDASGNETITVREMDKSKL